MGLFAIVDNAFWTDPVVIDNFTPEDKYFYLYLLTNVHLNVAGCFEVSLKQVAQEMGYSKETVEHLIERFINVHKVIDYDKETREVLIINWAKYHWTTSGKYLSALRKRIDAVKTERFSLFLNAQITHYLETHGKDFIRYQYGINTLCTDTSSIYSYISNNISSIDLGNVEKKETKKEKKEPEEATDEATDGEESVEVIDNPLDGHSAELNQAVEDWLAYKKEKRQKYAPRGKQTLLKTIAKKADEFGDEAMIEAIEQTMANGYQGIVWEYLQKKSYDKKKSHSFSEIYEARKNARTGCS